MSHPPEVVDARRLAPDVALLAAGICGWLVAKHAVIPTLSALAVRHFRQAKHESELEPKHPAVKFVLGAWNEGDFSEAEEYVASSCAIYTNGFGFDSGPEDDGPVLAKESIEYWRAVVTDLRMELSHEIREKDRIAIEWLITGTHTGDRPELPASGNAIELEGSTFLTLEDDKIVEARTVFDGLSLAVQTGAAEAPSWWPGRTSS